jgi:RNA 3'-terminal phosphate cyclase (ATP)
MKGISAVQSITGGKVRGLGVGSTEVEFHPKAPRGGRYRIDIGTAGSITLILQVTTLPAAFANGPVEIDITGGTDVDWSPPADYMRNVFYPLVGMMGIKAEFELIRRGYYPKGGGEVKAYFEPIKQLNPVDVTSKGDLKGIYGVAHSLNLPLHVVERERKAAMKLLHNYENRIELESGDGLSTGTGITLWAKYEYTTLGASSLGKPGKRAESVGEEAAEKLLKEMRSPGAIDSHMCDQIIPYMALAEGKSRIFVNELTNHLKTNVNVVENILGVKFDILEYKGGFLIEVEGIGFEA